MAGFDKAETIDEFKDRLNSLTEKLNRTQKLEPTANRTKGVS